MAPGSTFGKSGAAPDAATCHMPGVTTRCGVTNPRVDSIKNYGNKNFVSRRGGKKTIVQVATWNVRSLVNFSGPAGTAFVRQEFSEKNLSRKDDRRIDIVVDELRRLRIEVAGLQETLWFGRDIFSVADSMVLTSGKKLPGPDGEFRRGGGVAIVLRGRALSAWRSGGSQWRPISSRLAVAQLQTESCRLHVIVCYAPTFHSKREAKENFYDELQATLRSISEADRYVLLGDFNARVGSRLGPGDEWRGVRGPHGVRDLKRHRCVA